MDDRKVYTMKDLAELWDNSSKEEIHEAGYRSGYYDAWCNIAHNKISRKKIEEAVEDLFEWMQGDCKKFITPPR